MAGGGQSNPMTPDGAGGQVMRMPEPSYGGNPPPFLGAPSSPPPMGGMRPTPPMNTNPPTNPTPAVMPPEAPMSPLRQFRMGYPDRYADMPADRMPQRDMSDPFSRRMFNPFGSREQQPGGPTWSQQGGVFNYDPNGRPAGGGPFGMFRNMPEGFNPFGGQMPDFATLRQQMQDYIAQRRQAPPARSGSRGLGAINPYREEEG